MTKSEIIQSLAYIEVPSGTTLVERSHPTHGLVISSFEQDQAGGMKIIEARIFADQLAEAVKDLPEEPNRELFERLHGDVVMFHQMCIDALTIEVLEDDLVERHRKVTTRLREIATSLSIAYTEPSDHLLQ